MFRGDLIIWQKAIVPPNMQKMVLLAQDNPDWEPNYLMDHDGEGTSFEVNASSIDLSSDLPEIDKQTAYEMAKKAEEGFKNPAEAITDIAVYDAIGQYVESVYGPGHEQMVEQTTQELAWDYLVGNKSD